MNQATSPTTWTVTGVEYQDVPLTMTAHAYCMAKVKAPLFLSHMSSGPLAQLEFLTATSATCPTPPKGKKGKKKRKKKPRKLLSGGGFASTVFSPGTPELVFGESRGRTGGRLVRQRDERDQHLRLGLRDEPGDLSLGGREGAR